MSQNKPYKMKLRVAIKLAKMTNSLHVVGGIAMQEEAHACVSGYKYIDICLV